MKKEEFKKSEPLIFILFGATGDLARKKIVPALENLYHSGELPKDFTIIAFSRRPWGDKEYGDFIEPYLKNKNKAKAFLERIRYVSGTFDNTGSYKKLAEAIRVSNFEVRENKKEKKEARMLCHFAVEPEFYSGVAKGLSNAGCADMDIMIEKPFGFDLASAKEFDAKLAKVFHEKHILHIDHYLTKKALQDLIKKRKDDQEFEETLNGKNVEKVNIFLNETHDLEGRGRFYDKIGTVRDVGQNHMMQMFAAIAMDLPSGDGVTEMRNARAKVMQELGIDDKKSNSKRAQYEDFREENEVDPNSETETFFSIDAYVNSGRWKGTCFHFEAGKNLKEERKEIEVLFKNGEKLSFALEKTARGHAKAYETLIKKALACELRYFVSVEEIMAEWKFTDKVRSVLLLNPLIFYKKGGVI